MRMLWIAAASTMICPAVAAPLKPARAPELIAAALSPIAPGTTVKSNDEPIDQLLQKAKRAQQAKRRPAPRPRPKPKSRKHSAIVRQKSVQIEHNPAVVKAPPPPAPVEVEKPTTPPPPPAPLPVLTPSSPYYQDYLIFAQKGDLDGMKRMIAMGVPVDATRRDKMNAIMLAALGPPKPQPGAPPPPSPSPIGSGQAPVTAPGSPAVAPPTVAPESQPDTQQNRWQVILFVLKVSQLSVDEVDSSRRTALSYAAISGSADIIDYLIFDKADLEHRDGSGDELSPNANGGNTPLMLAVLSDQEPAVARLLLRGANVDAEDAYSNTPLIAASRLGELDIAQDLIRARATLTSKNMRAQTALMAATEQGHQDIVAALHIAGEAR